MDSLAYNSLKWFLISVCHFEFDGVDVSFVLRMLLMKVLSVTVLLVSEPDVTLMSVLSTDPGVTSKPCLPSLGPVTGMRAGVNTT